MKIPALIITLLFNTFSFSQIRIKAVGDVMMGSRTPKPVIPSDHGRTFVDSIAQHLDGADLCFANLEGVFVNDDVKPQKCSKRSRKAGKCYEFGMPDTLAYALKDLNVDVVSMDNNHNSDYGRQGVNHTKKLLDQIGISYAAKKVPVELNIPVERITMTTAVDTVTTGSQTVISNCTTHVTTIDSLDIAIVAFGHSSISYHVGDLKVVKQVVSDLTKKYEIVMVSFHGGAEGFDAQHVKDEAEEYYGEKRGNVYQFAHTAIDAGADLVIGHGPHVLRAVELYNNKLICYSLGNFLTYGNVSLAGVKGVGAIMDIVIDESNGDFVEGKIIPTKQIGNGIPVYDKDGKAIEVIKMLTSQDFPEGTIKITDAGQLIK